jgi:hypothetical protein
LAVAVQSAQGYCTKNGLAPVAGDLELYGKIFHQIYGGNIKKISTTPTIDRQLSYS